MEGALLWVAERRAVQGCSQTPPPESSAHSLPTVLIHVHSSWNKGWWPEPPQPIAFLYDTPPRLSHCWEFNLSEAGTL